MQTLNDNMKLTRRDVMRMVYQGERSPYVPWVFSFTHEAFGKLAEHYGGADRVPRDLLGRHVLTTGQGPGDFFEPLGHDDLWRDGSYGFAPAHAVEGDVPLENMLAFSEEVQKQPGYAAEGAEA